ncbi:MAG: phosphoenolpyruvate--protein phosphotransferase [Lachnospiraceae bacterium]|nr:phosphoenolpyruvate--protein phosphotransferase [Lachnospiraceae bacterium]
MIYSGISASKGVGFGKVVKLKENIISVKKEGATENKDENERYTNAINSYKSRVAILSENLDQKLSVTEGDILRSHLAILDDPEFNNLVLKQIKAGKSAEESVSIVCEGYADTFRSSNDEILIQKIDDVIDIKQGILSMLSGESDPIPDLSKGSVIVGRSILPSILSSLDVSLISGIVSDSGNDTSHSAILAKSMNIPMICGATNVYNKVNDGDDIIVDALNGDIIHLPEKKEVKYYKDIASKYIKDLTELEKFRDINSVTTDGQILNIYCNLSGISDISRFLESDGEGIGLLRTEMIFMNKMAEPSEDEQFKEYLKIVQSAKGRPTIIRTLDAGGDKNIPYLNISKEENPFLGIRAIRFCLKDRALFKRQIRAILRASHYGNVEIMLPMVTCVSEVSEAKAVIEECKDELRKDKIPFKEDIKIGCMIETPSAAIMADELAKVCDFFSIGTNDLIQYTMCADRGNSMVSYLYSVFQPAVLRLIRNICLSAKKAGIKVEMCGEAAANEILLPVLVSLKIDAISVSPGSVLKLRRIINGLNASDCNKIADRVYQMSSEAEIFEYLSSYKNTD